MSNKKLLRAWYTENGITTFYAVKDIEEATRWLNMQFGRALHDDTVLFNAGGLEESDDTIGAPWSEWYNDAGEDISELMENN